ncbi:CheR family methyltransferase [Domibacillus robiginosus]|uniref:CheR family methyltransferase n=1 Tax=Domibacillus robiginosus TaxID=1071054 RepID=UPI0009E2C0B7|nr:protein-glutamate O-methyltransferase CheR [Domibacillus robiginosus]
MKPEEIEKLEIELLLEAVFRRYGYDFRNYSYPSIRRRVWHRIAAEAVTGIAALQEKVIRDPACMNRLFYDFSINVTEMFRDPLFFLSMRENVIPLLRTYPFIRIWVAGCSTGEEAFSLAILLEEEGLLSRSRIYATDMNARVLQQAAEGRISLKTMKDDTDNYRKAGGKRALSDYYTVKSNEAVFHSPLKECLVFAQHNLVTDKSFNEFHLILCRNVLIYFNRTLQEHVHDLFYKSLSPFGFLGLGNKESIRFTKHAQQYKDVDVQEKIYRKIT